MNMLNPSTTENFATINDFSAYAHALLLEEITLSEIKSSEERLEGAIFSKIEVKHSIFTNCTFYHCNFEGASFVDVIFQDCDLSNSKFTGSYFDRCKFIFCKGMGIEMDDTTIKHTVFENSNFQYASFDRMKATDVLFDHLDFTESSMSEAKLKKFTVKTCRFVKNNFFKTLLAGVDFSDSEFIAPIVSVPPCELKGTVINMLQAADLITLWDIIVKK